MLRCFGNRYNYLYPPCAGRRQRPEQPLWAKRALVVGRAAEALSLVRSGFEASKETSPGFVGPILFGLMALVEPSPGVQQTALCAGESLLDRGDSRCALSATRRR
jgi:hypothetical protein